MFFVKENEASVWNIVEYYNCSTKLNIPVGVIRQLEIHLRCLCHRLLSSRFSGTSSNKAQQKTHHSKNAATSLSLSLSLSLAVSVSVAGCMCRALVLAHCTRLLLLASSLTHHHPPSLLFLHYYLLVHSTRCRVIYSQLKPPKMLP